MKCENCPACKSYFDGLENVPYCDIGVSEDEAYHDGDWYCNYNRKTIEKRLREKGKINFQRRIRDMGIFIVKLLDAVENFLSVVAEWFYE